VVKREPAIQTKRTVSATRSHVARPRLPHSEFPDFDPLIHERVRLGILTALSINDFLSFNDLKRVLKTTDGNVSVHARKLEDAGHVYCKKFFEGRVPRTEYRLTAAGRRALTEYLDAMEKLIAVAKDGGRERHSEPDKTATTKNLLR
jgi:DNA-binding MarR family transcriptional regulator